MTFEKVADLRPVVSSLVVGSERDRGAAVFAPRISVGPKGATDLGGSQRLRCGDSWAVMYEV